MLCVLLESPHRGDSNALHSTYNYCEENKKKIPKLSLFASWLGIMITLSGSNYPGLEQFSMVLKMFEQLKFDCIREHLDAVQTRFIKLDLIIKTRFKRNALNRAVEMPDLSNLSHFPEYK